MVNHERAPPKNVRGISASHCEAASLFRYSVSVVKQVTEREREKGHISSNIKRKERKKKSLPNNQVCCSDLTESALSDQKFGDSKQQEMLNHHISRSRFMSSSSCAKKKKMKSGYFFFLSFSPLSFQLKMQLRELPSFATQVVYHAWPSVKDPKVIFQLCLSCQKLYISRRNLSLVE